MPALTPRTRLIFQNCNIFAGPAALSGSSATGSMWATGNVGNNLIAELKQVTSAQLSVGVNRQDINVFGLLQRVDQIIISPPTIQMSFGYNLTDGYNENMLGFNTKGGAFISGILTKVSDSKNYFISVSQQGVDDDGVTNPNNRDLYCVGNGFISNYSINASVGQVPTASVSVDALNAVSYTGSSGLITPAVNPTNSARITQWTFQLPVASAFTGGITSLRPGDISMSFPNGAGFLSPLPNASDSINLQSFDLSVPISREVLNRLGSPLGFSREIQFPVNCQLSLRALATEIATGSFDNLYTNDQFYNATIKFSAPGAPGSPGADAINLGINGFKVDNWSWGMTVGGDATIDIQASAQLAGATSANGITLSGQYGP